MVTFSFYTGIPDMSSQVTQGLRLHKAKPVQAWWWMQSRLAEYSRRGTGSSESRIWLQTRQGCSWNFILRYKASTTTSESFLQRHQLLIKSIWQSLFNFFLFWEHNVRNTSQRWKLHGKYQYQDPNSCRPWKGWPPSTRSYWPFPAVPRSYTSLICRCHWS